MADTTQRHSTTWVFAAAALVAAAAVLLLYAQYLQEAATRRRLMVERGRTVMDAMVAGIRAHGRMGRYHTERLAIVFDELAETPAIVGLQLTARDGVVVAASGDTARLQRALPQHATWEDPWLIIASRLVTLRPERPPWTPGEGPPGRGGGPPEGHFGRGGRGRGHWGPGAWEDFPEGPYVLAVMLDATETLRSIRRDRTQFVVSTVIALAAVALGTLVASARVKRRGLEAALTLAEERAAQHERLAQLGAGLAHETKNPLGVVRGLAQAIAAAPEADSETKRLASSIVDEADRTVGHIDSFLSLARPKEPKLDPVDLDGFFGELLPLVQPEAAAAGVTLTYAPSHLRIEADRDLLRRAVLNILLNALRASAEGDEVSIDAQRHDWQASIRIRDRGCGIRAEDLPRVSEPYFSRFEGGTGLGMAIVDQIARAHGWRLDVESALGSGTEVTLAGINEVR